MEAKKPFWKTTSGLLMGCIGLVILALLCACTIFGIFYFVGANDTTTKATTPTPAAPASRVITDMVMAKNVQGANFDPVDVTYAFPANQSAFHAVVTLKDAPKDTAVSAVWSTEKGQRMGEFEIKSDGSRNLDFTFQPDNGKLPPGNYKVEIRLNGTPERTMNFTVQEPVAQSSSSAIPSAPPPPTTTRTAVSSSSASSSSIASSAQPKPSGFVNNVTMAQDTQGANKDPLNPTTVFGPNSTFHAVVRTQNAPANTKFKSVWYAVDVGSAAAPNTLIDETDLTTDGTRNIDFTLAPSTNWPNGSYRVEIYVNGILDTVKLFTVSTSGASSAPSSSAASSKPQPSAVPQVLTECGVIPPGQGGLLIVNYYGQQMNFTISGTLYKIDGNSRKAIFLAPGKQNYSANIPGVGDANGSLDIVAGQCFTQSWANR